MTWTWHVEKHPLPRTDVRKVVDVDFLRHLNNEITEQRVEAVQDAFNELMVQNVQLEMTEGNHGKPEQPES